MVKQTSQQTACPLKGILPQNRKSLKFPFKSLKKIDGVLFSSSNFTTQTKHGHINWTLAQVLPAFNTLTTAESNNSRQLSYSDCWPQSEVQLGCYLLVLEMLDSKCTDFTLQPLICQFRLALFLRLNTPPLKHFLFHSRSHLSSPFLFS